MKNRTWLVATVVICLLTGCHTRQATGIQDRKYWVETLTKIAEPVLTNLADGVLKKNMPFESLSNDTLRVQVSYLEAAGRTLAGISPWLELGPDNTEEGKLRAKYTDMAVMGIKNAVDPQSPDYMVFDNRHSQSLVDASFFAHALLRAPKQLWGNLDEETRARVVTELKRTRLIRPNESNWLLFASMIEAVLLEFTGECDSTRLYYGVNRFCNEWYEGDGWYGDGHEFRMDYYNSFVIHPMLTDILLILKKHEMEGARHVDEQLKRLTRFAEAQERFISPEATYPAIGRSIVYRFGAFHALSQASLMEILPKTVEPAQVRCALTAIMKRQINAPDTFDQQGWLKIGFAGSQINMSEAYINTGSLYLCTSVFLPLEMRGVTAFAAVALKLPA